MTARPAFFSERSRFTPPSGTPLATGPTSDLVIDLTETNPTRVGLAGPRRVAAALHAVRDAHYEPDPLGMLCAREAVAKSYAERGISIDPSRILLTASTSEAYAWLFKLLCDPGDEVLIPRPSYPLFDCLARLEAVRTVDYPLLREEGFRIDTHALERLVGERTRAIVLVAPNNPTGTLVHEEDAAAIEALASRHGLALIVDEVFADYLRPDLGPHLRRTFAGRAPTCTCFVLSGLSKVMLAPQLKLGWMIVSGPAADSARERLEIIADTFLSVSSPVQLALPAILAERASVQAELSQRLAENVRTLAIATADDTSPVRALWGHGGWCALIELPRIMSEDDWVHSLAERANVLVQPGWFYDIADGGTLIVSLIVEPTRFRAGIERVIEQVARLAGSR